MCCIWNDLFFSNYMFTQCIRLEDVGLSMQNSSELILDLCRELFMGSFVVSFIFDRTVMGWVKIIVSCSFNLDSHCQCIRIFTKPKGSGNAFVFIAFTGILSYSRA